MMGYCSSRRMDMSSASCSGKITGGMHHLVTSNGISCAERREQYISASHSLLLHSLHQSLIFSPPLPIAGERMARWSLHLSPRMLLSANPMAILHLLSGNRALLNS